MIEYDATVTRIFNIAPYSFFVVIGVVCATSLFILLLLRQVYDIPRYTKVYFLSGVGLLIGARFFGALSGLYRAFANGEEITFNTFANTGIVFYGGMLGFLLSFVLISKIWLKVVDRGVLDILAVSIPTFHFWGRLGCFFGGCCFGIKSNSSIAIVYTTYIMGLPVTATRLPIQLIEAAFNLLIAFTLLMLLFKNKMRGHLLTIYLVSYAVARFIFEFYRGDLARGVWNGISFSQVVSSIVILVCAISIIRKKEKAYV